jgi:hypothetical protein
MCEKTTPDDCALVEEYEGTAGGTRTNGGMLKYVKPGTGTTTLFSAVLLNWCY